MKRNRRISRRYGRKTTYDAHCFPDRAGRLAAAGRSDYAIAESLRVDLDTLATWCRLDHNLRDAIAAGREQASEREQRASSSPAGANLMIAGAGGCHRCSGYVTKALDMVFRESLAVPCLKCMACGAREYSGAILGSDWKATQ